jgi:hypothetical protein
MPKEAWPLKLMLGGMAISIGVGDLTFGSCVSSSVLLLIGLMFFAKGVSDRRGGMR